MTKPYVADRGRKGTRIQPWGFYAVGLIVGAVVPAAVAVALLASVALHRPVLARAARPHRASATRLTIVWALTMVTIAAVQGAGAMLGMWSVITPAGLAARSGFAVAVEAVALVSTAMYLPAASHRPGPSALAPGDPSIAAEQGRH
jgi:hypothetical protein